MRAWMPWPSACHRLHWPTLPARWTSARPAGTRFPRLLEGKTIAVARDLAFSFIYTANLDLLQQMGASRRLLLAAGR
jgi:cobyrinic acid a,c-diamide synthase